MQAGVEQLLAWKGAVLGAWFLLLFLLERRIPAAIPRLAEASWRRLVRNAALWAGNLLISPLVVVPISAVAASAAPQWRPQWWSGVAGLLLDLVLLDFLIYWWHRANHVVPLLWRFHSVHHLDRFLDTTSAVRFHAGEVVLSALARACIILLLAVPLTSVVVFETLVLVAALFHHSNLRLPPAFERALSLAVVTPSIHWVHHHRLRADTDANYCTILSLWDRLFMSRARHRRTADMAIGVEAREEERLFGLLAAPFRRGA
ncbi:MAG TPA: sterol desaturase family protein [Stellaceae bacterium]|nr:sterol desaturase family protein [Stellaceae bacterium]